MKNWLIFSVLLTFFFAAPVRGDVSVVIAKVKPSVVIVGTFKPTNSPRFALRGTGFVVGQDQASMGNLVITNAHVLAQPAELDPEAVLVVQIRVRHGEWQMRPATVVEVDKAHDLALLRFEGPAVSALTVGDSDQVREGQAVPSWAFQLGVHWDFRP